MSFESKKICTFFLQNQCAKGATCRFQHTIPVKPKRAAACKFFRENKCTLGANCRFEHTLHSRDNSTDDASSFPHYLVSDSSLVSSPNTPAIVPTKLPLDQRTATHSDNSQPQSNLSQPKSDSGRIVKGEINGLTFQVEIVDPASIMALAPRREVDEETDYSYVEPEPMVAAMHASSASVRTDGSEDGHGFDPAQENDDAIAAAYQKQLDELEERVRAMQSGGNGGHHMHMPDMSDQFATNSDYSEYSDLQPAIPPKLCKFHQQGLCRYGDACIYSHASPIDPEEEARVNQELLDSQAVVIHPDRDTYISCRLVVCH
ncbi:Aste57867_6969 [Aphanomyces stellatus]|uniref:Aste57867_6969 protein n=1 Tax=Aphanomyces stellatus TaxID=120398 RepID=A0A485KET3_9STRA|nr:hypothetical protein As57867_006947 [Aphanomyces stellatus]VFT83921.1 Aste57867_6969 [Aphanomyces stellatus]